MKTLIFDFDGTIADSFETFLVIFQDVTKRKIPLTQAEVIELRGKKLREIIKYLRIKKWQIPKLILKAKKELAGQMPKVHAFPGVKQAMAELSKDNQILILSTNSPENIAGFLKKNRMDGYVTRVYGNIGLRGKTAALKKLIKAEELSRTNCIYIGDETRDIEAARKAKVISVGVTWGFNNAEAIKAAKPDIVIEKTRKLAQLLK